MALHGVYKRSGTSVGGCASLQITHTLSLELAQLSQVMAFA